MDQLVVVVVVRVLIQLLMWTWLRYVAGQVLYSLLQTISPLSIMEIVETKVSQIWLVLSELGFSLLLVHLMLQLVDVQVLMVLLLNHALVQLMVGEQTSTAKYSLQLILQDPDQVLHCNNCGDLWQQQHLLLELELELEQNNSTVNKKIILSARYKVCRLSVYYKHVKI